MTFKSYYGPTIREALNLARLELGPDAAILASRQTDPSERLPGAYEVVCAVVPGKAPAQPEKPKAPAEPKSRIAQVRKGVSSMRTALLQARGGDEVKSDYGRANFLASGFGEDLASEVAKGVARRVRDARGKLSEEAAIVAEFDARLSFDPSLGRRDAKRRVTALVGPPGAGKTSLLVKVAVRYGLTGRKPIRIVTLDAGRVGGADALTTYAAGMAVPFDGLETGASLLQVLQAHEEAGLILIDTPGDLEGTAEMAAVLAKHSEIDVQLVLPATMSALDMRAAFRRYRPFLPARIAVTHLDNAVSALAVAGLSLSTELPVSFLGTGPRIPEDLEEGSITSMLRAATSGSTGRSAVSAA